MKANCWSRCMPQCTWMQCVCLCVIVSRDSHHFAGVYSTLLHLQLCTYQLKLCLTGNGNSIITGYTEMSRT